MDWFEGLQLFLMVSGGVALIALAVVLLMVARILKSIATIVGRVESASNLRHWIGIVCQSKLLRSVFTCSKS